MEKKTAKALKDKTWDYTFESGLFVANGGEVAYRAETGEPTPFLERTPFVWESSRGKAFFLREWSKINTLYSSELIAGEDDDVWTHPTQGYGLVQQSKRRGCTFYRLERDKKPVKIASSKQRKPLHFKVRWLCGTDYFLI